MAWPSGAWKSGNPTSLASVDATSAEVTGRSILPRAGTIPGPYQSMGTSWV